MINKHGPGCLLVIVHIMAACTFPLALVLTIPLHIMIDVMSARNK